MPQKGIFRFDTLVAVSPNGDAPVSDWKGFGPLTPRPTNEKIVNLGELMERIGSCRQRVPETSRRYRRCPRREDQPIIPHRVGRCTTTTTGCALVTRITIAGSVGMWTYMIRWNVPQSRLEDARGAVVLWGGPAVCCPTGDSEPHS